MSEDTWKAFEQNLVSHSVAHHVVAIAKLREKQGYARVSDVAKALNITRGSASLTLKSLKHKGYVLEDANRFLLLSERGQFVADSVRGKKDLLKKFLGHLLGVPAEQAEVDTCKIEHLISDTTAQRLALFLRCLESEDGRAKGFRRAWEEYERSCEDEAEECPAGDAGDPDALAREQN